MAEAEKATAALAAAGAMTVMSDDDDDNNDDDDNDEDKDDNDDDDGRQRWRRLPTQVPFAARFDRVMGDAAYDRRHQDRVRG